MLTFYLLLYFIYHYMKTSLLTVKQWITYIIKKIQDIKDTFNKQSHSSKEIESIEEKLSKINQSSSDKTIELSSRKDRLFSFRFWIAGIIIGYIGYIAFETLELIYMIIAGIIISIALESIIIIFQRLWINRTISITITYIASIFFLLWWLLFIIPFITSYLAIIIQKVVTIIQQAITLIDQQWITSYLVSLWISEHIATIMKQYIIQQDIINTLQQYVQTNAGTIATTSSNYIQLFWYKTFDVISKTLLTISNISIIIIISLLCSIEKTYIISLISRIWWSNKVIIEYNIQKIYIKLWYRLKWQLLLCVYIWLLSYTGLRILWLFWFTIPDKWYLAIIAWLTEFIPYIGPILWSIPAILIMGIEHGIYGIIAVIWLYWVIQRTENNILIPLVMNQTLWVSSLLIFISILIGGSILGIMWIILAIPFAAIITIAIEETNKTK